jgi:hypothetical protein
MTCFWLAYSFERSLGIMNDMGSAERVSSYVIQSRAQPAELDLPGQAHSSESTPTKFISMTPTSARSSM